MRSVWLWIEKRNCSELSWKFPWGLYALDCYWWLKKRINIHRKQVIRSSLQDMYPILSWVPSHSVSKLVPARRLLYCSFIHHRSCGLEDWHWHGVLLTLASRPSRRYWYSGIHISSQFGIGAFRYRNGPPYSGTGLVPASAFLLISVPHWPDAVQSGILLF